MSYGFLMRSKGFSFIYPTLMSLFIFAGSMEFVTVNLLLSAFNPVYTFFLTLMVNARHLFYGISMLEKYKNCGWKKLYLVFGMCDESFSINCTVAPPPGIDRGWFMFFVTLLKDVYKRQWLVRAAQETRRQVKRWCTFLNPPAAPSVLMDWKFRINPSTGKTAGVSPERCR